MPDYPHALFASREWQRCYTHFLDNLYARSQSHKSVTNYSHTLAAFFAHPAKHPAQYTRADVEDFIHHLTRYGKPPAIATRNNRLKAIASFYRFAASYLLPGPGGRLTPLLQTPSPTVGIPYGKPARRYRFLTRHELERFFAAIPTDTVQGARDRACFLLFFWSARRRSEIARLLWGDLEEGMIADEEGHRHKGWLYHFRGKGQGMQDDVAELPAPAKAAIDAYIKASGRKMRPDSPLFASIGPTWSPVEEERALTGAGIYYQLKRYAKLAGLDCQRVCLHSLRHTAARERYSAGSDVREIQHLLRHASLATTDAYLSVLVAPADPGAKRIMKRFRSL